MSTDNEKLSKLLNLVSRDMKEQKVDDFSMYKAGDIRLSSSVPYGIPTQLAQLDLALGRPGYPVGRIIEVFGFEGSGKTTLGLHAIAQAQSMGGGGLFVDTECTFDPIRAQEIGVDTETLLITEADSIERIFMQVESTLDNLKAIGYDKTFVIVVDSITGVSTEEEQNKSLTSSSKIGGEAMAIRRGIRRINYKIAEQKVLMMFINHAVAKLTTYGKPSQAAGGHALKFFSSVRIEVASQSSLLDADKVRYGQKVYMTVEKLKGAPLRRPKFETELHNDVGFDRIGSLLEAFEVLGIVVHPKGSKTYTWKPTDVGFTRDGWKDFVASNGGFSAMYKVFHDCAIKQGEMSPWRGADV